ncbi:MAG: hypothetical protein ACREX3_13575 [Gammaproteobacteria bacterium]
MSRDSLRGFAHLGLLATLLQGFLHCMPHTYDYPHPAVTTDVVLFIIQDHKRREGVELIMSFACQMIERRAPVRNIIEFPQES